MGCKFPKFTWQQAHHAWRRTEITISVVFKFDVIYIHGARYFRRDDQTTFFWCGNFGEFSGELRKTDFPLLWLFSLRTPFMPAKRASRANFQLVHLWFMHRLIARLPRNFDIHDVKEKLEIENSNRCLNGEASQVVHISSHKDSNSKRIYRDNKSKETSTREHSTEQIENAVEWNELNSRQPLSWFNLSPMSYPFAT